MPNPIQSDSATSAGQPTLASVEDGLTNMLARLGELTTKAQGICSSLGAYPEPSVAADQTTPDPSGMPAALAAHVDEFRGRLNDLENILDRTRGQIG